jgi:hypothetical protein
VFLCIPRDAPETLAEPSTIALLATGQQPVQRRFPFGMTSRLPQISLPIGLHEDRASLQGLLDTCAGVNLGYLPYHQSIAKRFPQVTASYTDFAKEDYRTEHIGGVDGGIASVVIVAAVDYFMPYQINGSRARLRIALSNQVATNTIFSLPFLMKSAFVLDFKTSTVHSTVFGETYKLAYVVPPLDESPPMQNPEMGLSLLSLKGESESEDPSQE